MQAVLGRIALFRDPFGVAGHQEHADATRVTLAAPGARGDDQRVGGLAVQYDEFLAVDHPTPALFLGRGRDVVEIVARVLPKLREPGCLAAVDGRGNMRASL